MLRHLYRPAVSARSVVSNTAFGRALDCHRCKANFQPKCLGRRNLHSTTALPEFLATKPDLTTTPTLSESDVVLQLRELAELQRRVAAASSRLEKQVIIGCYPQLRDILYYIYTPNRRLGLTRNGLRRYIKTGSADTVEAVPSDLLDLLRTLERVPGTTKLGKDIVVSFLLTNGIVRKEDGAPSEDDELWATFGRLLDLNLKAGFGRHTLSFVKWASTGSTKRPTSRTGPKAEVIRDSPVSAGRVTAAGAHVAPESNGSATTTTTTTGPLQIPGLAVALGSSPKHGIDDLFTAKSPCKWFASRKLDGVRCLALIDVHVPTDISEFPTVTDVRFVSRSGNEFTSLSRLAEQVYLLSGFPMLRQWLDRDPAVIETRYDGVVKRLVLDGEVCVMREMTEAEKASRDENVLRHDDNDSSDEAARGLWTDDGLVEDFSAAVSQIKRLTDQVQMPTYFLLDVLNWGAVESKQPSVALGLGRTFGERIPEVKAVAQHLDKRVRRSGGRLQVAMPLVKTLPQCEVTTAEDAHAMIERATLEDWEGLVMRADRLYKGKRSPDILKFKKWQEAEYTVKDLDIKTMSLNMDGATVERQACSNIWIEHKGHPVSVGTGFTIDQRLRFAEDPSLILGKDITVLYFGESEKNGRDSSIVSLRFPRIKKIWEDGRRTL